MNSPRRCMGKRTKFLTVTTRRSNEFSLKIGDCDVGNEKRLLNFLKVRGPTVLHLCMSNCCWKLDFFREILKCLPNLNHLELVRSEIFGQVNVELPELKQLATMKIDLSRGWFRGKFRSSVTLANYYDLLKSQKHLKRLSIRSVFRSVEDSVFLRELDMYIPFQLTHLSLKFGIVDSIDCRNFLKFLAMQSSTIISLELEGKFPQTVYELVFSNFKILKSLRLEMASFPTDETFYMQLEPNNSINTVTLVEMAEFPETLVSIRPKWFTEFIRHAPKVTDLSLLTDCCFEVISFLSYNLKEIKKLTVRRILDTIRLHLPIHFPKLLSLSVGDFEVNANWRNLVRKNPQIEELAVKSIRKDASVDMIDAIREFIDSINPLTFNILRIGERHYLLPIRHLPIKCGTRLSHWTDLECWIDGDNFGSFEDKLLRLSSTAEIFNRRYAVRRIEQGRCVIDLESKLSS